MTLWKVYIGERTANNRENVRADYMEIENGVLKFYETPDSGKADLTLGDVPQSNDTVVTAYKEWSSVERE